MFHQQKQFSQTRVAAFKGAATYEARNVNELVRQTLAELGFVIQTGETVVLKPNWVKEHDERHPGPDQWEHVVTHPALIEAVTRWVAAKLAGSGSIIICDAPQTDSSFARLREYCRLDETVARCRKDFPGVKIDLLDSSTNALPHP